MKAVSIPRPKVKIALDLGSAAKDTTGGSLALAIPSNTAALLNPPANKPTPRSTATSQALAQEESRPLRGLTAIEQLVSRDDPKWQVALEQMHARKKEDLIAEEAALAKSVCWLSLAVLV
jgi:hypothetical protein